MSGAAEGAGPTPVRRPDPLTRPEKRRVVVAAGAPVVAIALLLLPVALLTTVTAADVAGATAVYGGLLGLAAGFVAADRAQARRCPRCQERAQRGAARCEPCGYDLADRPRYACPERHLTYLDAAGDGRCACGRRLERLPEARGVGRQVVATLRIGGLLLAFLLVMGLVLQVLEGRL